MDRGGVGSRAIWLVGTLGIGVVVAGCADAGPPINSFADAACNIWAAGSGEGVEWREVLRLGDEGGLNPGAGFLTPATTLTRVVRDHRGRYWVGQDTEMKVFSPEGEYLRVVGRSGQGPMEFGRAHPFHVDGSGHVHVFDYVNARITVIGEAFERVDDMALPGVGMEMAPLEDGAKYVLAAWVSQADRIGLPLHVVEDGGFTDSFGIAAGVSRAVDRYENERIVAADESSDVFAVNEWSYEIEAWSVDGQRTGRVVGPTLDDGLRDWDEPSWTLDNPPWNRIRDITVDSSGRLWVLVQIRQADWRDHATERIWPDGSVSIQFAPSDDPAALYRSRVDVLDLSTCTMTASKWFDNDGTLEGFVDGSGAIELLEYFYGRLGDPLLRIWRLEVNE